MNVGWENNEQTFKIEDQNLSVENMKESRFFSSFSD